MAFTPKQLEGLHSYDYFLVGEHKYRTVQWKIVICRDVESKFLGFLWPTKTRVRDVYLYEAQYARDDVVQGCTTHIYSKDDRLKEDIKFIKDYVAGLWEPTKKEV